MDAAVTVITIGLSTILTAAILGSMSTRNFHQATHFTAAMYTYDETVLAVM